MNYTAALSYGHTGFGVLKVGSTKLSYDHFKATNMDKAEDSAQI